MDKDILSSFVNKLATTTEDRLDGYLRDSDNSFYFKRYFYYRIEKYVSNFLEGDRIHRWIVLPGLRGTGKTTLLAQINFYLINKKIKKANLFYISLDEALILRKNLYEILEEYENYRGELWEKSQEPIILLVDEAHYDPQWALSLKTIYEKTKKNKNVFILVTGSSALSLQSNTDTARRVLIERVFPLVFTEYLLIKKRITPISNLKNKIENALYFSDSVEQVEKQLKFLMKEMDRYLTKISNFDINKYITSGSLPYSLEYSQENAYKNIITLMKKIVFEDIPRTASFDKETIDKVWTLLLVLAMSDKVNYQHLSSMLKISEPTLISMVRSLSNSEAILRVPAYGNMMKGVVKKSPKYLFLAPILRAALLWNIGKFKEVGSSMLGKLLEDVIGLYLCKISENKAGLELYHDSAESSADFILKTSDNKLIALEVGYGLKREGEDQLKKTMSKLNHHVKYGILINQENNFYIKDNIIHLPLKYFLLS
ncbi:AAA family ATPase [archaeon]|nr:AAA family ATPase [archaeon]